MKNIGSFFAACLVAMALSLCAHADNPTIYTGQTSNPETLATLAAMSAADAAASPYQHRYVQGIGVFDWTPSATSSIYPCSNPVNGIGFVSGTSQYACPNDATPPSIGRWVLTKPVVSTIAVVPVIGQSNTCASRWQYDAMPGGGIAWEWSHSYGSSTWSFIPLGSDISACNGGPWGAFAQSWYANRHEPVMFILCGVSGSAIDALSDTGQGNWGPSGTLRYTCTTQTNAAIAYAKSLGYTPHIIGGAWLQGENEGHAINVGTPGVTPAYYSASFLNFITYFNSAFGYPVDLYVSRVGRDHAESSVGYDAIGDAQSSTVASLPHAEIAFWGARNFYAQGYMWPDGSAEGSVHYNTGGADIVGIYLATQMQIGITHPVSDPSYPTLGYGPLTALSDPGAYGDLVVVDRLGRPKYGWMYQARGDTTFSASGSIGICAGLTIQPMTNPVNACGYANTYTQILGGDGSITATSSFLGLGDAGHGLVLKNAAGSAILSALTVQSGNDLAIQSYSGVGLCSSYSTSVGCSAYEWYLKDGSVIETAAGSNAATHTLKTTGTGSASYVLDSFSHGGSIVYKRNGSNKAQYVVGNEFGQAFLDFETTMALRSYSDQHVSLSMGHDSLGFYGASPVAQASRVGQLTDNTGGSVSTTLSAITAGASYSQTDMVNVKNALASITAKLNAAETALHNIGVTQ